MYLLDMLEPCSESDLPVCRFWSLHYVGSQSQLLAYIYYGCWTKYIKDEWIFTITGSEIVLATAVCNLWSLWWLQRVIQISMIGPSIYNCFLFIVKKTDCSLKRGTTYHAASSLSLQYVLQMCLKFWETEEGICGCRLDCGWFLNSLRDFI